MTSNPRKSQSSTLKAVDELRDLIFTGALRAGSDHLESELALALGMSRTPVREALLVLQGQGLVDVRPRKGARIKPISPTDMAEIYDVLTELESLAAANAARSAPKEADLATLSEAINDMDRALRANDLARWAEADEAFHCELVRLGGNSRISQIVAMMSDQVKRARLATLDMRPAPTRSNTDHRDVLDAIRKGDADQAQQIHHAHRTAAKEILIDLLETHHLNTL